MPQKTPLYPVGQILHASASLLMGVVPGHDTSCRHARYSLPTRSRSRVTSGGTTPRATCEKSACTRPSVPTRARREAARRWHIAVVGEDRGRGQPYAGGQPAWIVRAPHQGRRSPGPAGSATRSRARRKSRRSTGHLADAEDLTFARHAAAHELALGFQPRPRLIVVGACSATRQDEGTWQGEWPGR